MSIVHLRPALRVFGFIALCFGALCLGGCGSAVVSSNVLSPRAPSADHTPPSDIPPAGVSAPDALPPSASPSASLVQPSSEGAAVASTAPRSSVNSSTAAVDWTQPSGGEYPKLSQGESLWIDVSIGEQRVYIKDGDKTLYTMVTSSGLDTSPDNSTPQGTFYVQAEKGLWFFSQSEQEGAKYYTSWKNHGEFLFHSVPMDKDGNVIATEAEKLGQKASHGCLRLTIPDAKWIYEHIPVSTKVVIRE